MRSVREYPLDGSTSLSYDEWHRAQYYPEGQGWKVGAKKVLECVGKVFCCLFFPCCYLPHVCFQDTHTYGGSNVRLQYNPATYDPTSRNWDGSYGRYGAWEYR